QSARAKDSAHPLRSSIQDVYHLRQPPLPRFFLFRTADGSRHLFFMSERKTFPPFQGFLVLLQFFFKLRRRVDRTLLDVALHYNIDDISRLHTCPVAQSLVDRHHVAATHGHQGRSERKTVDGSADWHPSGGSKPFDYVNRWSDRSHDSRLFPLNLFPEPQFLFGHQFLLHQRW